MKAPRKINHEDTKDTKKDQKKPMRIRFFVVDFHSFWASLTVT